MMNPREIDSTFFKKKLRTKYFQKSKNWLLQLKNISRKK